MDIEMQRDKILIRAALQQLPMAHAPYSKFHVGAALLTEDGMIYGGCNIENAAYPAGNCAERTAIFKAVSEGKRDFCAIAIVGGKRLEDGTIQVDDYCAPCGICRQVMAEFVNPETFEIILCKSEDALETDIKKYRFQELLPCTFSKDNLN